MWFFRPPHYRSDLTQFIEKMKEEKPDLEARQRAGRALWWDRDIDRRAWADWRAASVPQKAYVYQTDVGPSDK